MEGIEGSSVMSNKDKPVWVLSEWQVLKQVSQVAAITESAGMTDNDVGD